MSIKKDNTNTILKESHPVEMSVTTFPVMFRSTLLCPLSQLWDASNLFKCFGHYGTINEMCILLHLFLVYPLNLHVNDELLG